MMNDHQNSTITFAEFELDTVLRRLTRDGETVSLHSKAFDLLAFLIENNGRVVTKDEIFASVWEDRFVEESNLVVQISNLRKALGESKNSSRFLITVPGKGYKFAASTNEETLVIETHSVSEFTIEDEEEVVENWSPARTRLMTATKWRITAAVGIVLLLAGGIIGYFRFLRPNDSVTQAFVWTGSAQSIDRQQLTANGNLGVAAISPDGTLYAYTNEGSELSGLWVAGVNGSQIIEVLPPAAIEFGGLTFAPDGLHIYYTARDEKNRSGALFRVPTLGGIVEKVLSDVCCPVTFSPDGKQVAYRRDKAKENLTAIVVADVQGTAPEREIAFRPREGRFNDNGASWSPDGTKIAIGAKDELTGENAVFLVDVQSGNAEKFGEKAWNYVRRVEWLPDGSGLFVNVIEKEFWEERQIWLINYPSAQTHQITADTYRYGRETVSVSKDGSKLLGVGAQTISNIFVGDAADVTDTKKITQNSVGKNDGFFNSLTWTPDNKLVFTRHFDKSNSLWIADADGANAKQLTPNGGLDRKPVATRDGRYIVFYSLKGGGADIWRINQDGSNWKQLSFDGGKVPTVTPDGNWVLYQAKGFIWKVSIDGGEAVQMTRKASKSAEVSPDGKTFACFYRPTAEDKLKLAVFPIDGGEPLYIFDVRADLPFEKLRWTPDGRFLVYAFYNSTAWRQPLSGGTAEKFLEFPGEVINAFDWSNDGKQFAVAHGQELRDVVLFYVNR